MLKPILFPIIMKQCHHNFAQPHINILLLLLLVVWAVVNISVLKF